MHSIIEPKRFARRAAGIAAVAAVVVAAVGAWSQTGPTLERIVQSGPLALCGAPGTDLKYIAAIEQEMLQQFYERAGGESKYFLANRWPGNGGAPKTLTWSLVPDGLNIPSQFTGDSNGPSEMFSRLDNQFSSQGGRAEWIARFEQAFDRWSNLTGITFVRVTDGVNDWDGGGAWNSTSGDSTHGDIRLCMRTIDGSNNVLAFSQFPGNGTGGNIVMDRAESWGSSTLGFRFLRNVLMHETGHSIGMLHVCPLTESKLMEPLLTLSFLGPQQDDLRGAQEFYGDPYEPDNSAGNANDLGTLVDGNTVSVGDIGTFTPPNASYLSIDDDAENDYWQFTLDADGQVSVLLEPVGSNYDSSSQASNGSCNSGSFVNALAIANLDVQLIDTDQSTVLETASANGAGSSETITDKTLAAGTYYLRVYENNSPSQSQLYRMEVSFVQTTVNCPGDLDGNFTIDLTDLGIMLGNYGMTGASPEDGDINGDTVIDLTDLGLLLGLYGTSC